MEALKIVLIGIGELGQLIAGRVMKSGNLKIIGAIDTAPGLVGKDLGIICGGNANGIIIESSIRGVLNRVNADAAILTTVSTVERIMESCREVISCAVPLVTTCEELAYPWQTAPHQAAELDIQARKRGVPVVATGVNPGFLMDFLPLVMSSICQDIENIRISRIQDAGCRRLQFQNKVGVGMTIEEFNRVNASGGFGHIGLPESIYMLSDAFKWRISRIVGEVSPVMRQDGKVAGILQTATGYVNDDARIELYFKASAGETAPCDQIEIKGTPSFTSRIDGGINGDAASAAIVLNCVASLRRGSAGFHTMMDFPLAYWSIH